MTKRLHAKPYEHNMRSIKLEYSTDAGPYCTMHDIKVTFYIPDFSSIKIILHHFHVDKNKGKSGIGYDIIIFRDLMVQLVISDDFERQLLQWDGDTVPMK